MGRRFGPTRGAGTVILEKEAAGAITPGQLGTTAYTGIMQKGPVAKAFRTKTRKEFLFRAGSIIPESQLPDAALDRIDEGNGSGDLWLDRVTDGNEKLSKLTLTNRRTPRASALEIEAGNEGRWAGAKQLLLDEYTSITATTLTMANVPGTLQDDELVDALVILSAVPGKSFKVVSNTSAGVLSFAADIDLVAEIAASSDPANKLTSVTLSNSGAAIAAKIKEGTDNPTTEWALELSFVEGGISEIIKTYDNMSSDPNAKNFFEKVINDDPNADFTIRVNDLYVGSITPDIRPANYAGVSTSLTTTVLTAQIWDDIESSVLAALAKLVSPDLGSSVAPDSILLTVTTAGARAAQVATFGANPTNNDTLLTNGKTWTFKNVVTDATSEILIGGDAEATIVNSVAAINASIDVLLDDLLFAEKTTASTMTLYAQTAGTAGNAFTTAVGAGVTPPTWAGVTLAGGLDQIWSYVSTAQPFLSGLTVTSGVAFASPNEYGFGFTLIDETLDSTKVWANGDTLTIVVDPLEVNKLADGLLYPKASDFRTKHIIASNTASTITVKVGSDMIAGGAVLGDDFRVEYARELGGGYDGTVGVTDLDFTTAYDTGNSPLKSLRGKNLGLIKLATPGVTATAVQKAGAAFAQSQNWQYRYEVPANIVSETAAEEYINETVGRNDFAVAAWPSFAKVLNPNGVGLKLTTSTGSIHGEEARIARDFDGFHKAAAGEDAVLSKIVELPDGVQDLVIDEEFINPIGIQIIKKLSGNFVIWGDRNVGTDTNFRFKHQREYISHIENVFLENFDFIIFALNNAAARERLKPTFVAFFIPEFAKSAIVGKDLADAARIKIDDENNTPLTTSNGDLNAEVGVQVVDTVERFIITISKLGVTEALEEA